MGRSSPWRLLPARESESVRWECGDGRWVALTLGEDEEINKVVVSDSAGRRQLVDSYEDALALAKVWRRPPGN